MNNDLSPVIHVDETKCVNCHTCISVCPVKYCIDGSGEKVSLQTGICIGCGQCIKACTHGARSGIDDFAAFMEAAGRGEKMIAIAAPSVVAKYPEDYLRLNGWLATLGVQAVFDVAFGAELTVESYIKHIEGNHPELVIAQPCPAIVSYIELYQPELLPYLAPAHSPMLHTIVMIREYFPEYRGMKIMIISPCVAKRREFDATGLGDYNVTLEKISAHLEDRKISLRKYPEKEYSGPIAERAALFSSPGGLKETVERERPGITTAIRKMEGPNSIYPYLKELPEALKVKAGPLILDCLNCEKGCNGGTGTGLTEVPVDILEAAIRKRAENQKEKLKKQGGIGNGMGVPTTANYVITSTITAPAIVMILSKQAGLDLGSVAPAAIILPAHMFAFYFGIIADVTPPVALAAFAGAGIAKGNPMKTGINASKLAVAAFLVPYIFVLNPQMLLFNVTPLGLIWMLITSLVGITAVAAGVGGWFKTHMAWYERVLAGIGGILLVDPGLLTDVIGACIIAVLFIYQTIKSKKANAVAA